MHSVSTSCEGFTLVCLKTRVACEQKCLTLLFKMYITGLLESMVIHWAMENITNIPGLITFDYQVSVSQPF